MADKDDKKAKGADKAPKGDNAQAAKPAKEKRQPKAEAAPKAATAQARDAKAPPRLQAHFENEVRKRLVASENVPTGGSARDFARQVAAEADSTAQIVKAVGIKAE